ncbi:MAG: hypothetical protein FWG26_06800 [Betaproteobacteria bacterium]|nr:hypothetical protein [Betaproteobacteria bacterium]
MHLLRVNTRRLKKEFIDLYYRVYAQYQSNRDNFNYSAANFLYKKDSFSRNCQVEPMLVSDGGYFVARAVLLRHPRMDALQLGCFEALPDQNEAVNLLLERASCLAREWGIGRVIIGMSGHLTYGIGLLKNRQDLPATFSGTYNPKYYLDFFSGRGFIEHTLTSYYADTAIFDPAEKQLDGAYSGISYRFMRLNDLEREMAILGDLFNKTLDKTRFYFHKDIHESYEMIRAIRPLLKDGNIIYAMKDGREIGFVIWYPNFNEIISDNGRINPLLFFLRCKLFGGRIREFMINTIGVLAEYENTGVSLGLVNEIFKQVNGVYRGGETSFVWDDNSKSRHFCRTWCRNALRHYVVYEWILDGNQDRYVIPDREYSAMNDKLMDGNK